LGYVSAILLLIVVISQSVMMPAYVLPFFQVSYIQPEQIDLIGIYPEDLHYASDAVLLFIRGRHGTIADFTFDFNGEEMAAFTPEEYRAVEGMQAWFSRLFVVRNVAFFMLVGIILGMALLRYPLRLVLSRCVREIMVLFLLLMVILTVIVALNLGEAFEMIQLILFGEVVRAYMSTGILSIWIQVLPTQFFAHLAIFMAGLSGGIALILIVISSIYLRSLNRFDRYGQVIRL